MTGKRTTGKRRSTSTPRGRRRNVAQSHRAPFFLKWLNRYPRWTWWVGGIGIALLYIWVFYYFFVSPTGFSTLTVTRYMALISHTIRER